MQSESIRFLQNEMADIETTIFILVKKSYPFFRNRRFPCRVWLAAISMDSRPHDHYL